MSARSKMAKFSFADILAPLSEKEFFRKYYGQKHLYIPGNHQKFSHILPWDGLNNLLNMTRIWNKDNLVLVLDSTPIASEQYCEPALTSGGQTVMRPVAAKVMGLLKKGATLGLNDIDSLTPELAAVANAIEHSLHAKVQSNLYCSWQQRKAFSPHFDSHDVYAFHLEGEKIWRIYESVMDYPINHPAFKETTTATGRCGEVIDEITLKPGDFLYIPRGCYHDALSSSEATYHIAFGATGFIGLDIFDILKSVALHEEVFRHNFPLQQQGPQALASYCEKLAQQIGSILTNESFQRDLASHQAAYHYPRGGMALPVQPDPVAYHVTSTDIEVIKHQNTYGLKRGNQAVSLPKPYIGPMKWVVTQKNFTRQDLRTAFDDMSIMDIDKFVTDLLKMKVIAEG